MAPKSCHQVNNLARSPPPPHPPAAIRACDRYVVFITANQARERGQQRRSTLRFSPNQCHHQDVNAGNLYATELTNAAVARSVAKPNIKVSTGNHVPRYPHTILCHTYGAIQVLRNAVGGGGWVVVSFPGKKHYGGVRFNVITRRLVLGGGQIPRKKMLRNT